MEKSLQDRISYHYKNEKLLAVALTHSSYANESKGKIVSNERLEFLGDAVLSIITADYLFHNFPDLPEGELTKWRASLVCEKALCGFARELGLGGELRLGKGEQHSGGAQRPSILADAFEAVIASIYLDGGMDAAKKFVLRFIGRDIHSKKLHVFEVTHLRYRARRVGNFIIDKRRKLLMGGIGFPAVPESFKYSFRLIDWKIYHKNTPALQAFLDESL